MSDRLDALLRAEMARWDAAGLRRDLDAQLAKPVPREREFASNDYLSLSTDPRVVEAARDAIARHGAGGRAARLLGGGCELDRAAERACAEWLGAEDALLFPSGWQANAGVLGALCGPGDAIVSDELNHASIVDGARAARASVLVFAHNDLDALQRRLVEARGAARRLVVVESVFSMDGDLAPLAAIHELCARHHALLVVDEAHAAGVIGPRNAGGWASAISADSNLAARIVTGGKALGVSGAFVVGSTALREHLANRARSFVFTTAVSPAVSGALAASIELVRTGSTDASSATIWAHSLWTSLEIFDELDVREPAAAIVSVVVGSNERALEIAALARERNLDVRAVRPPTVPVGTARLRISCHAHNSSNAVSDLEHVLRSHKRPLIAPFVAHVLPRTLFVAGTDTDVGKTVVCALLVRFGARHGAIGYWKPVQTGMPNGAGEASASENATHAVGARSPDTDEDRARGRRSSRHRDDSSGIASDTDEVRRLTAGVQARFTSPAYQYELPASPHTAAAAAGESIDLEKLRRDLWQRRADMQSGTLVVELAGGLLVPLDERHTQADWLARERPDVVVVARAGLGTLNHTLLTLEALRARLLEPRALFLVGEPHAANAATLRARSNVASIFEVPRFDPLEPEVLDAWIDANDLSALFGER